MDIKDGAFGQCSKLCTVSLGTGIKTIGYSAFSCSKITSIDLPTGLTSIGENAFYSCNRLFTVLIPSSVTTIGINAFSNVSNIIYQGSATGSPWGAKSRNGYVDGDFVYRDATKMIMLACNGNVTGDVTIPSGVVYIGRAAFVGCSNVTSISIPNSVTNIMTNAFSGCQITSIDIPNSVTILGDSILANCRQLESANIPEGLTGTGKGTFYYCIKLEHVTIPMGVTTIGEGSFSYCFKLDSFNIPNSVTSIENNAFGSTILSTINIPDNVVSIGADAFVLCRQATSATIGSSVTEIGSEAFAYCKNLTSLTCKASIPPTIADSSTFTSVDKTIPLYVPSESIESYRSAMHWRDFTYILSIPSSEPCLIASGTCGENLTWELSCDSILSISGSGAMEDYSLQVSPSWYSYRESIKEIILPESITSIGAYAFQNFSNLKTINIPEGVNNIGIYAFRNCNNLPITNNLRYADTYLVAAVDKNLSTYVIKAGTRWIGTYAFYNCKNMTSIEIPNSVISIEGSAFSQSGITSIEVPQSVTTIKEYAFENCYSLLNVTIPDGVISIGNSAFYACSSLQTITFPNTITELGKNVVNGCINLVSIKLPNTITTISGFNGCRSLESITIPENVQTVEGWAFNECIGLRSIICEPVTPPSVGQYAFEGVDKSIPILYVPFESLSAYSTANQWKDFNNILPKDAYWVKFLDWDSTEIQSGWVKEGTEVVPPAEPSRVGYTFIGWDKEVSSITQDTTISALYKINRYQVDFVDWNDSILKTDSVEYMASAVPPADPTRTGYTFVGWDKNFSSVTQDTTIIAVYKINLYQIIFADWDGTILKTDIVEYMAAATPPENPTREGYTFIGWNKEIKTATQNAIVIAQYEINHYRIDFVDWDIAVPLKSKSVL